MFLAKQNGQSHSKISLLSAPGSVLIKTTLMKRRCGAPDGVLVKTSTDNTAGRQRAAQMIEVPGAYTCLR